MPRDARQPSWAVAAEVDVSPVLSPLRSVRARGRAIRLFVRRAATMTPALVVLALGLPTTDTLVVSQLVLSFGIPFALVPLTLFTRRPDLMGALVNRRATTVAASLIAAVIVALNVFLIGDTLLG